ncbi:OmpA family protein [Maribacter sp.]|nr:OmpA family protein [Maribacter sp.]
MQLRNFIVVFFIASLTAIGQELKDDGDKYFYGYAYEEAIKAYQKQMQNGDIISNHQFLNLADSYFKTGDYQSAAKIYLDINKKDSIMSDNRFNKMLQSLAKTSEPQRVRAFLKSKSAAMTNELMENASFNFEILEGNTNNGPDFNIFNLNTNSPQADISPAFYKDKLLFSTSRKSDSKEIYGPTGESYLDIFEARIGNGGVLMNQNSFRRIPKVDYHKATPFYSEDLNSIFYVSSNVDEDGELAFDTRNGKKNALAIGLIDAGGSFRYVLKDLSTSFYYPFYDDGTGKLYFAANFEDGYGGTDIYYVFTNNAQVMSEPINLGPRINTAGNEIAPYMQDNSFYFSSDIFYGLGGMDIYKSNIQADESYSIPVNLGEGINSTADDFGLIIRPNAQGEGLMGYFSSNRKGGVGQDDIYGFQIAGKPGLKTLVFDGVVLSTKTLGIADVSVKLLDAEQQVIKEVVTGKDGAYRLEIPWREQVSLQATKSRHSIYLKTFKQTESNPSETSNLNIEMALLNDMVEEKENKTVLKLDNFYFEKGRSTMNPQVAKELIKVIGMVEKFPHMKLRIETHTSSKGRDSSNKRVSQEQANAIRSYLLKNGVNKSNIDSAIGYGEEQIVNNCKNGVYCLDFLHDQNIRTLFVVLNFEEMNKL